MSEEVTIEIKGEDKASDDLERVNDKLEEQEKNLDKTRKAGSKYSGLMKKIGKGAAVGLGVAAGAVGTIATRLGTDAVRAAADFERGVVSAGAKANATSKQLNQMKEAAIDAGKTSEFSAKQAADALGFLAQAGLDVNEQIEAIPGTLELASAGSLDLATAADIATDTLSGMGMEVRELGRINDVLVKTANSANTNVEQLGRGFSEAAPLAASAGVEVEELAAILGKMASAGIKGAKGGVAVRAALAKLKDPTGDAASAMQDAGIEIENVSDLLADKGLIHFLEKLAAGSDDAGKAFVQTFGTRAGPKLQSLLNQGIDSVRDLNTELERAGGTAEEVAEKKIETLAGSLKVLEGSVDTAKIQLGDKLAPAVQSSADALTEVANQFGENAKASEEMNKTVASLSGTLPQLIKSLGDLIPVAIKGADAMLKTATGLASLGEATADYTRVAKSNARVKRRVNSLMDDGLSRYHAQNQALKEMREGSIRVARAEDSVAEQTSKLMEKVDAGKISMKEAAYRARGLKKSLNSIRNEAKKVAEKDGPLFAYNQRLREIAQTGIQGAVGLGVFTDALNVKAHNIGDAIPQLEAYQKALEGAGKAANDNTADTDDPSPDSGSKGDEEEKSVAERALEDLDKQRKKRKEMVELAEDLARADRKEAAAEATVKLNEQRLAILREEDQVEQAKLKRNLRLMELAHQTRQEIQRASSEERKQAILSDKKIEQARIEKEAQQQIAEAKKKQRQESERLTESQQKTISQWGEASAALQDASGAGFASSLAPAAEEVGKIAAGASTAEGAIDGFGKAASGFGEELGASASAQAGIMAVFETAMGLATMFTNPAESAAHFAAAANFTAISAMKAGEKSGGGDGGESSVGGSPSMGQSTEEAARQGAEALSEAMKDDRPQQKVQIIDFSGATVLEDAPKTQERISDASQQAEARTIQRSRRRSG